MIEKINPEYQAGRGVLSAIQPCIARMGSYLYHFMSHDGVPDYHIVLYMRDHRSDQIFITLETEGPKMINPGHV